MTAGEYKVITRHFLCPNCGGERSFRNSAESPTRWKCQGAGCPVSCIQDVKGIDLPIFEGAPEPDWLEEEIPQLELEDLPEPDPEILLKEDIPQPSWGDMHRADSKIALRDPPVPVQMNLAGAFDLTLPLQDRVRVFGNLFSIAAEAMVFREEDDNPEAYADPDFRRQQIACLELRGITEAQQILNRLVVHWTMEHGEEEWIDADGQAQTLKEVIEAQMPSEEQRKSSGRARQVAAFKERTIGAFRKAGFSDERIAECNNSGMSSVLGIVSSAQHRLEQTVEPDELPARYDALIQAASETTSLDDLKRAIQGILDPDYEPPPTIRYSVENDGDHRGESYWVLLRPSHDQFIEHVLPVLKLGEVDKMLPEYFYRYWGQFINVPPGHGEE